MVRTFRSVIEHFLAMIAVAGLALAGCGRSGDRGSAGGAGADAAAAEAAADPSKPWLTEGKMEGMVRSLQERPEFFRDYGKGVNAWNVQGKVNELNAFAKKYGFRDFQDYSVTLGRIIIAKSQVNMEAARVEAQKEMEKQKSSASPEAQKAMEEAFKNLSAQPGPQVNDADTKLVEKYWPQFDAGMKKVDKANQAK
jgi:hypothetical protein